LIVGVVEVDGPTDVRADVCGGETPVSSFPVSLAFVDEEAIVPGPEPPCCVAFVFELALALALAFREFAKRVRMLNGLIGGVIISSLLLRLESLEGVLPDFFSSTFLNVAEKGRMIFQRYVLPSPRQAEDMDLPPFVDSPLR